jgi:hypothetical protein
MAKTPNRGKVRSVEVWVRPSVPPRAPTVKELWEKGVGQITSNNRYLQLADIALRVIHFPGFKKESHKKRGA